MVQFPFGIWHMIDWFSTACCLYGVRLKCEGSPYTTATPTPQHPSDADQQNSTTHVATVPGTPAASCPRRTLYHLCYWLLAKLRFATPAHHPLATITITCCQWSCKLVAAHVLKKQRSRDSGSGTHTHADTLRAWCGQCCYLDTTGFDVMPHTMGLRYIL
jgi:hypothetical protein